MHSKSGFRKSLPEILKTTVGTQSRLGNINRMVLLHCQTNNQLAFKSKKIATIYADCGYFFYLYFLFLFQNNQLYPSVLGSAYS